jgi:hypothetical protein
VKSKGCQNERVHQPELPELIATIIFSNLPLETMKTRSNFVLLAFCGLLISGCIYQGQTTSQSLQDGYSLVTHGGSWMAEAPGTVTKLVYRNPKGRRIEVCGAVDEVVIHQNSAIFTGVGFQLYAFTPPGPALDITMPLTMRVDKQFGWKNPNNFYPAVMGKLTKRDGLVELTVGSPAGPLGVPFQSVTLSWDDIAQMMREASLSGSRTASP